MITIKSPRDFDRMRRAGKVVARIHSELREAAVPGVTMLELDRMAAKIIADSGCTSNFLNYHGFPATVSRPTSPGSAPGRRPRRPRSR